MFNSKKNIFFLLLIFHTSVFAMPGVQKRYSDFERDLNGDGFIDIALADCSSNQDFFGDVRVYFGSADGISITPGWTYTCTISNFMETK